MGHFYAQLINIKKNSQQTMALLKEGSTIATARREMKILGYPCRQTMGAFLRFKRETGREATEITNDLTDLLTFLYCCTASASAADGRDFDLTLEEFADRISPDELNEWTAAMQAEAAEANTDDEKKSRSASPNN